MQIDDNDKNKEKTNISPKKSLIKIKNNNINKKVLNSKRNNNSIRKLVLGQKSLSKINKTQIHKNFGKILNSLNESLYLSEIVQNEIPKKKKINLKSIFSKKIEEIKLRKINQDLNKSNTYLKLNSLNIMPNSSNYIKERNEKLSLFNKIKIKTPKRLLSPKQISRISQRKVYYNNDLMKYSLCLKDNTNNYLYYREKINGIYDLDKQLRNMIKESKVGIEYPGNIIQRDYLTYIKTFNPKSITSRYTKNYSIRNKAYLHSPQLKPTKFTLKNTYNERNIIY